MSIDGTALRSRFASPRFWRTPELSLAVIALLGFIALAIATGGNLLSAGTLGAFFRFLAVPIVIGLSQMVVLAVGQMNLSVGALTGLCAMVAAWLMIKAGLPAPLAVLAAVGVGLLAGVVNGVLVVVTRINGFIVTLATMTIIQGLRYGVNGPDTFQGYSEGLRRFGQESLLGLPLVFLVALAVAALVAWFFGRTTTGRRLLASGGSPFAARLSGISNDRSLVIAHALSGLLAGVAAVITVAASGSVNSSIGDDLLLPSFAAPIIGGVALTGGMVSVVGTLLAAFLVRLVDVMQAQFGINPRWIDLIIGAVVLGAVLLGTVRQRLQSPPGRPARGTAGPAPGSPPPPGPTSAGPAASAEPGASAGSAGSASSAGSAGSAGSASSAGSAGSAGSGGTATDTTGRSS